MAKGTSPLQEISPDKIVKNPDNPRLIFREEEMQELLESIREVGIKVPVSLYEDGRRYVLLDGERRWRCAKKLNLPFLPAIVQPKPSKLENLLMMFNIHNVRVDWDLMPMALKLGAVRELLSSEGKDTSPKSLAGVTGVRLPSVRRALDLLDLPSRYQAMLLREAEKPKSEQRITPDLFIEVNKSLRVVEKYTPEVFALVKPAQYVDALVRKYASNIVDNVVAFRELSKIARAELAGVEREEAIPAIVKLVKDPNYSITEAYADTVGLAYERRDLVSRIRVMTAKLEGYRSNRPLDSEAVGELTRLRAQIDRLLGTRR